MPYGLLASLGAGFVSAIVFASAAAGGIVPRLMLFLITPLPLFLAGLALGWRSAAVAAGSAAIFLAFAGGPLFALMHAATQALPAVLLCYLALLHRDGSSGADGAPIIEWYPLGRLVAWMAAVAAAFAILMLLIAGADREALLNGFKEALGVVLKQRGEGTSGLEPISDADLTRLAGMALTMMPAFSAMSWMLGMVLNLWLAGRVTLASGRLGRPWPDLAAFALPPVTPLLLIAAIAAAALGGLPGLAATAIAGAIFFAYLLQGLAIVHYATRPYAWRPFALWALYTGLAIVPGGPILVAILGLAEALKPLRRPPSPPPSPPTASPGA